MTPFACLIVAWSALALAGCDEASAGKMRVTLGGVEHELELAVDDAARNRGLMHRASLPPNGGMIFAFTREQVLRFWMKNCLIALDILYLDRQGRVVKIRRMDPPPPGAAESDLPFYSSEWPAQFAVELAAGQSEKLGLREGDVLNLPLERLKQLAR
jgi:hypothetical protein